MPGPKGSSSLDSLTFEEGKPALPQREVPAESPSEPEPEPPQFTSSTAGSDVFIPVSRDVNQGLLTSISFRLSVERKTLLREIADEYNIDVSKLLNQMVDREIPKIPRRRRAGKSASGVRTQ